jgi:arginine decarboxylase
VSYVIAESEAPRPEGWAGAALADDSRQGLWGDPDLKAKYVFLTNGVGCHKEKLASFEEALRDAKIAHLNLVSVSSILPPGCKVIPRKKGLPYLTPGEITFAVIARSETNEHRRLVAASVGLAIPKDRNMYGYLSENHTYGQTEDEAGDYAEDLAASMLATTLGLKFNVDDNWDQKNQFFKVSGQIFRTANVTQTAIGKQGYWTTVVAAAVFIEERSVQLLLGSCKD